MKPLILLYAVANAATRLRGLQEPRSLQEVIDFDFVEVTYPAVTHVVLGEEEDMTVGGMGSTVAPEEKFALYEEQARESFRNFKLQVDEYVNTLSDNEAVNAASRHVKGFYRWAMNRDTWESVAILAVVGLVLFALLSLVCKILSIVFGIVCLPFKCLTCCCRPSRRSRYY
ncbi:putative transmembrane protein [Gregarina niphandrodes]|uniref:Transmembrane protein n=1 Tax=Gregarina niphandrodes TaxID=110365 RepID=A0A023B8J2_GRENI|nr:putative transmembrane protein [Gregarina niphandrodes]EZG69127.1 putative transmembrane protein [Gregarina niphandrodes]|eukprot:XP_011134476.1 putative transmembrane protein [Gregarina niphandrodes]